MNIKIIQELGCINHITKTHHYMSPVFICELDDKNNKIPYIAEPDKHDDLKWFKLSALPENISSYLKLVLEKLKSIQKL